ncbi:hypothetical protein [uncultured Dialister sp.]|uniref:hypothetical protein n=1 Tax=uncultured Dialister sp. TaxID=278064 RepID=UPI00260F8D4D|nr:hypothetical protein [uncultured Dialister sp.]
MAQANRISITITMGEEGLTLHSDGSRKETRILLAAALASLHGIPEDHVEDVDAFLAALADSYRDDRKSMLP